MNDIEFVYFDLGNILVSFDPMVACQNVAELYGCSAQRAHDVVYDSGWEDRYEHGEVTGEQFATHVHQQLGKQTAGIPTQKFLNALGDMFQPIESMRQTVQRVRQSGRRIGILSNTCFAHWDWVNRQGWPVMEGPFEIAILSYEVGAMKPDGRIYAAAEQKAGVPPERILFLDDKHENVDAAISRGWNAAQCFGGDELVGQLKHFGIIS
ncbi:MAG: HAD family phosphatase [Pirellulaceae bacterium]|nr:HAD family phosphatase [Pirellulaceae bacterium]